MFVWGKVSFLLKTDYHFIVRSYYIFSHPVSVVLVTHCYSLSRIIVYNRDHNYRT